MADLSYQELIDEMGLFSPIKIGILGWSGPDQEEGVPAPIRMAVEEGIEKGEIPRIVDFVYCEEDGLPPGLAQNSVDGYHYLCDQGCLLIIGPHSNDNIPSVIKAAEERRVPFISMNGAAAGTSTYAFRLGNGQAGGEGVLMISWLKSKGYKDVGILVETVDPDGFEQFDFFQYEARKRGINIRAVEYASHFPKNLAEQLARIRDANVDALVFLGAGMNFMLGNMLRAMEELDWNPPRICNASFMYYPVDHDSFEGWVGVDQYCPDNPCMQAFKKRYEARYAEKFNIAVGTEWADGLYALAYDFGRVVSEAIYRAPELSPEGLRMGLEKIRWLPACTGGPGTHIDCNSFEHNMFSGDWLVLGRIEEGKLTYEDKFRPAMD